MNDIVTITRACSPVADASVQTEAQRDFAFMCRYVPGDEQRAIRGRLKIVALMGEKPTESEYLAKAKPIAERFGLKNWSWKTAYRWVGQFDADHPYTSMMDNRVRRRISANGIGTNEQFVAFWQELCMENKRCTSQAYTELFSRLRAGETIPGIGTWRDIFAVEAGGFYPAPEYACPYMPGINVPKGWTLRNLNRIKPGAFALTAMRQGNQTAALAFTNEVLRTRVGLKSGQCWQIDDMWYEEKVIFKGNRHAQRVVEFAIMDVKTCRVAARLTKPVIEGDDGHLKTLKAKWARYLIAHVLCEVGIPPEGCVFQGEHGTATLDRDTQEMLHGITHGLVSFSAGGLIDKPLVEGLKRCRAKGNPRFKGMLEGHHALVKGHLGAAPGHMGGGRGHEPEWADADYREFEALMKWAEVAERERPGIMDRLRLPYVPYVDFLWLVEKAYAEIDRDVTHNIGQWEECGFTNLFWRANPKSLIWEPSSKLLEYPAEVQALMDVTFKANPKLTRLVKMSRLEAWEASKGDRSWKLDPSVGVSVMGRELSCMAVCNDKLMLHYKDPETMTDEWVSGLIEGGGSLTRGQAYLVYLNPCSAGRAYVCDLNNQFIGVAPVMQRARYADDEAVKKQLGLRSRAIAQEVEKAMPAFRRIQAKRAAQLAHNVVVMTGEDPALKAAIGAAAEHELGMADAAEGLEYGPAEEAVPAGADVDFGDLPAEEAPAITGEDLADLV